MPSKRARPMFVQCSVEILRRLFIKRIEHEIFNISFGWARLAVYFGVTSGIAIEMPSIFVKGCPEPRAYQRSFVCAECAGLGQMLVSNFRFRATHTYGNGVRKCVFVCVCVNAYVGERNSHCGSESMPSEAYATIA